MGRHKRHHGYQENNQQHLKRFKVTHASEKLVEKNYKRLEVSIYNLSAEAENLKRPTILRPAVDSSPLPAYYQPVTLLPPLYRLSVSNNKLKHLHTKNIEGNRMIHLCTLSDSMYKFNLAHADVSPGCIPYPFWPANYERDWGMGIRVRTCCRLCGFEFDYIKLYEDIDDGRRGERMAKLNLQVCLYSLKTSTGYRELALLFAAVDCTFMSEHTFYRILNKVAPLVAQLGEEAMSNNVKIVKLIAEHNPALVGEDGRILLPAQTDTLFNNAVRGRGYSSPGTQSITPVMEGITNKKFVIAITAFNQLCSKHDNNCGHSETECGQNYPDTATIDSTERAASQLNYEKLIDEGVRILRLCHDSITSSRHLCGMRDAADKLGLPCPVSSPCTAHLKRNTTKQVYKISFSALAMASCPKDQESKRALAIGCWFSDRCSVEIILAYAKFGPNSRQFVQHNLKVRMALIPCAMGVHTLCDRFSLICKKEPIGLPGNKYLRLTVPDQHQIWKFIIMYRMSEERIVLQRFLENTNRCESYHRTTLATCPKGKTYRRNYVPRCLSAAHTDSLGIMNAMMEVTHRAGAPLSVGGRAHLLLQKLQNKDDYHKERRKSLKHKKRVKQLRKKKAWMRAHRRLSFRSGVSVPDTSHDYATRAGVTV